jgi:hypothetical protein
MFNRSAVVAIEAGSGNVLIYTALQFIRAQCRVV